MAAPDSPEAVAAPDQPEAVAAPDLPEAVAAPDSPEAVAAPDLPEAVAAPLLALVVEPLTGFARDVTYSTWASIRPARLTFAPIVILRAATLESSSRSADTPSSCTTWKTDVPGL